MEALSGSGAVRHPHSFWIERVSAQGEVLSRHRIDSDIALVGRGYGCDLVLDDPQVAAQHLQVSRNLDGRLQVVDLGSRNGLWIGRRAQRVTRATPDGDTLLRIGSTWLRLRETFHAVAPESVAGRGRSLWLPALLVAATLGARLLGQWLKQTTEIQPMNFLSAGLLLLATVLIWSGSWALLSRLLSGEARFRQHLLIGSGGLLALGLLDQALVVGGYSFSLGGLQRLDSYTSVLVLSLMCWLHLRVIGPSLLRLKTAVVGAAALGITALILVQHHELHRRQGNIGGLDKLMPPAFILAAPQDERRFFADSAALKAALDRRRTEPVLQPGTGFNLLDDDD